MPGSFSGGLGFGIAFVLKDMFSAPAGNISKGMNKLDAETKKLKNQMTSHMKGLAGAFGVFATMGAAVGKAASLSDQLIDVQRSTGLTAKEMENLRTQLEGLDTRRSLPELLQLAELGGEMQVAKKDLLEFTKVADNVGLVLAKDFGGNAKVAVKAMGRLANRFDDMAGVDKVKGIEMIGSAINEMANKSGANAKKTEEFANKLAGLGFASADAIGLAASFDKLFPKIKGIGSQMQNLFNVMSKDDDSIRMFAKQTDMSAKSFKGLLDNDPNEAMMQLARSFRGMSRSDINKRMDELKLTTPELKNVMVDLAKNIEDVELRQNQAAHAMKNGSGLSKEANKRNKTLGASLAKLRNAFEKMTLRVGEAVGEGLQPFIDILTSIINAATRFAASPFGRFVIKMGTAFVAASVGAVALSKAIGLVRVGLALMKRAAAGAILSMGPLLLIVGPILGIVYAIQKATSAFDEFDGTVQTGLGGFFQKLGGVIRGIQEIWSSWDSVNQEFSLSGKTVEKLDKLGIRNLVVSIGTWVIRIKEFLKGVVEGFKEAWGFIWENILQPVFNAIGKAFDSLGFNIGKTTSKTDKWKKAGKVAGMVLAGVLLLLTISFIAMGVAALIAMIPIIIVMGLIGLAIWAVIKVVGWLIEKFNAMWEWVGGLVDLGKEMVQNIWDGAKSVFKSFASWWYESMKSIPGIGWVLEGGEMTYNAIAGDSSGPGSNAASAVSGGMGGAALGALSQKLESGEMTEDQVRAAGEQMGVDESIVEGALERARAQQGQQMASVQVQPSTVVVQLGEEEVGNAMVNWQNNELSRD